MENRETPKNGKTELYILIGILIMGSIAYRITQSSDFNNSSLLFVGIPALLAFLIIKYTGTPKSTVGLVFKVITLFLLISSIVLGEGIICILMAAPIFYLVGFLIAISFDYLKKNDKEKMHSLLIIPLVLMLGQPMGINKAPNETVSQSIQYDHEVSIESLSNQPDFQANLPTFFKLGFPKPLSITNEGIEIGDKHNITFLSSTKGEGTLSLEVAHKNENEIHFKIFNDDTHIGSWLSWHSIQVKIDNNRNQSIVTWTTSYSCDLGPQWYFVPAQRFAVELMNKHLIHSYFG